MLPSASHPCMYIPIQQRLPRSTQNTMLIPSKTLVYELQPLLLLRFRSLPQEFQAWGIIPARLVLETGPRRDKPSFFTVLCDRPPTRPLFNDTIRISNMSFLINIALEQVHVAIIDSPAR